MRVQEKKVYYCDFCPKRRMTKASMERHESSCTLNPARACRWKMAGEKHKTVDLQSLVRQLYGVTLTPEFVDGIRNAVGGCPACMLAVLRQTGCKWPYENLWKYEDELERFREAEKDVYERQDYPF